MRDLWALRLQTLQSRANYESESEAEYGSQLYSSQSEGETTDATLKRKTRKSKTEAIPQLVDALSLCYIGTLLLRLPTTVNDFYRWAASGELLYYRAITILEVTMKQRLPFNYSQVLDPQSALKPSSLHKAVFANIMAFNESFDMQTPALNHVLVLYRWIEALALPLEVYSACLRIAKLLEIDFRYEARSSNLIVLRFAEARLMALLVMATKLLFPLDGVKRHPRRPTELSALAMDWSAWSTARDTYDQSVKDIERLGYEDALRVSEQDVIEMSNDKLDEYMDWYGSTFTNEDVREKGRAGREAEFRRAMFRFFPIDRPTKAAEEDDEEDSATNQSFGHHKGARIKDVQAALRPIKVKQDGEVPKEGETTYRPGSRYKRYREASELSGHAERFYKEAAKLSGLSVGLLVRGVFGLEKRLQEWEEKARKGENHAE